MTDKAASMRAVAIHRRTDSAVLDIVATSTAAFATAYETSTMYSAGYASRDVQVSNGIVLSPWK